MTTKSAQSRLSFGRIGFSDFFFFFFVLLQKETGLRHFRRERLMYKKVCL